MNGSKVELEQVFVNLINNAIQAMKGRGRLTVKSRSEAAFAVVTIQDTGSGIKKEHINQVFIPFFTTKDPGKGTGLGLNIVHTIITNHGGNIRVESEEGKGSTFIVKLPLAEKQSRIRRKIRPGKVGRSIR